MAAHLLVSTLVLDHIFCHLAGTARPNHYPEPWHTCLMATSPANLPRFHQCLLMQCRSFQVARGGQHLSVPLVRAWFSAFAVRDLGWDPCTLATHTLASGALDVFDWLVAASSSSSPPFVITAMMVDMASGAGVPSLDRVWRHHCHISLPIEFPFSTEAVDNARDAATLDWWWQKHLQHGLIFRYDAAAHQALTGHFPMADGSSRCPDHPAMYRWWHDRAIAHDLVLSPKPATTELDHPGSDCQFTLDHLVSLAEDGQHEALELWGDLVDRGLLPAISSDQPARQRVVAQLATVYDVRILDWWLDRFRQQKLAFGPPLEQLPVKASAAGRLDLLDWCWHACQRGGAGPFTVPDHVIVSGATRTPVTEWWLTLHATHHVNLPAFRWSPNSADTCDDLQAFLDLKQRHPGMRIECHDFISTADVRVLEWACAHAKLDDAEAEIPGLAVSPSGCFALAWNANRIDTLDLLMEKNRAVVAYRVRMCVFRSAPAGPLDLLEWWRDHPTLHQGGQLVQGILRRCLVASCFDRAAWWLRTFQGLGHRVNLPALVAAVCEEAKNEDHVAHVVPALLWLVDEFGPIALPVRAVEPFLEAERDYAAQSFLESLALAGTLGGVSVAPFGNNVIAQARWDHLQRLVRLSCQI
ncbi:hypothetical protein BC828DRAFT_393295 [Blastocladiella britannica]|nr:hypothetical protein BC828DRAFT_393295 [Blastocladiella britannica]